VLATAAREHRIAAAIIQNPFVDGRAAAAATSQSRSEPTRPDLRARIDRSASVLAHQAITSDA
jgi:hypothetical protein